MSENPLGFKGVVPTSRFLFEVDGVQIGVFGEVSGLRVDVEVTDYAEGGENGFVHRLPGRMTWPHLVLRRGICDSDALFAWINKSSGDGFASAGNKLTRCTGAVTTLGDDGSRLRSWDLRAVFPVRWTGPDFASGSDQALSEELELAHHGFTSRTYS